MTSTLRHPRNRLAMLFCLVTAAFTAGPARAWDLIYTDRADVTLCEGCGLGMADWGFALIANTGAAPITATTFFATTFDVVSSHPGFSLVAFVNDPGPPVVAPILPGEVVGSVIGPYDDVLLSRLSSGEVFRNTAPNQVFALVIDRLPGETYEGPVAFDVRMTLGGELAQFTILCDMHLGDHAWIFPSAARTSSVPLPTPSLTASWGAVRTRYR